MSELSPNSMSSLARASCGLVLGVALGLSACSKDAPTTPVAGPAATDKTIAQATAQQQAALVVLSLDDLKKRGSQAMREQRLYAPAGDNAMEYYLTLRHKSAKPDASAENALSELTPYAVIAAEQAIGRADFVEAERLRALIERTDPQAPALSRIAGLIAKGQADIEQNLASEEAARVEQLAKAAEAAKLKAAQQAEATRLAAASTPAAPVVSTPPPETSVPASAPVVTAPAAPPEPAPAPVVVAKPSAPAPSHNTLIPISTPQPDYPPNAQRAGTVGAVVASFTVNADGSVSNIVITSAKPRGVFDRNVQAAVRRWKFQPIDKAQTVTRTFNFTL